MLKASLTALAAQLRRELVAYQGRSRAGRAHSVLVGNSEARARNLPHVHHHVLKVDF